MKLGNTSTIPARLDIEPIELFIPEPIEAWALADFAGLELVRAKDDDIE